MTLPSQGGFSSLRRGSMYRKRRRRKGTSWFFVVVAATGLTWYLWPSGSDQDEVNTVLLNPTEHDSDVSPPTINEPDGASEEQFVSEPPVGNPIETIINTPEVIVQEPAADTIENEPDVVKEVVETIANTPPTTYPLAATSTKTTNLDDGLELLDSDNIVGAWKQLSKSLRSNTLSEYEVAQARGLLGDISDRLVFSPELVPGNPYSMDYTIRGGDTLSGIVSKMGLQVNWRFIQRINNIQRASSIRSGQTIKLVTGPFHAVINKDAYRIDLYLGDDADQVFVRSYRVGLGEFDSTPEGLFKVRKHSKLINPAWKNPRTGEPFAPDDPLNPIGERWIGLEGVDEITKDHFGIGIHGTIEPETIGTDSSMGCIRMLSGDVAEVYEMLSEEVSTVEIR